MRSILKRLLKLCIRMKFVFSLSTFLYYVRIRVGSSSAKFSAMVLNVPSVCTLLISLVLNVPSREVYF